MKKLTLIAALLSMTGIACYGQATPVDFQADAGPGTAPADSFNVLTSSSSTQWSTTVVTNGTYAGTFYTTNGNGTGTNNPPGGWDIDAGPGAYSDMYHTFDGNLTAGETLSLNIAINNNQSPTTGGNPTGIGGTLGINLVQNGGSFPSLFSLYEYNDNTTGDWRYLNGDLWPGADGNYNSTAPVIGTTSAAAYNFVTTDTFSLTMLDSSGDYTANMGGAGWTGTLSGGADNVDAIRIFNNNGGPNSDIVTNNLQVSTVPEPSTIAMMLSSTLLGGMYLLRRRRF